MHNKQLTELFKTEYSKLVAVLCHFYGVNDIQLAEDIVSETFISAMKNWSHNGVPDKPKAWLRKVAQNKLTDSYRRQKTYQEKVIPQIDTKMEPLDSIDITDEVIEDSQLRMLFVVCDPELNKSSQLSVALRILCGFNIEEIAKALLSNKEAINKKLYRAKKSFKENNRIETELTTTQYNERLDNVLRVIYLLFNEGYYSSVHENNIREDVCWEAMRLCVFLTNQNIFPKQKINALLALMCLHASRLKARAAGENGDLLYYEQDKHKWDQALIQKGEKHLNLAATGKIISKYHIEAAIAFWHTGESKEKWENILQLYNKLLQLEYSPMIALNRTYALAKANSPREAIKEANKLELTNNHHYYCMLAELYKLDNNIEKEIEYLNEALALAIKENQKLLINAKLEKAMQKE